MLKIFCNLEELDFRQLMDVYEETNRISGKRDYPDEPGGLQMLFAEQDFYQYLELFFRCPFAQYAVWDKYGRYQAALRLEGYESGLLVAALETLPEARRKGYATELLMAVSESISVPLYSHVDKNNVASLTVHKRCGFKIAFEEAVFLDGSVQKDFYTLLRV